MNYKKKREEEGSKIRLRTRNIRISNRSSRHGGRTSMRIRRNGKSNYEQ